MFSSPLILQGNALSSTSIEAQWAPLSSTAATSPTSTLSGYILFYKQTSDDSYKKIGVAPGSTLVQTLQDLQKFSPYRMVVCPYSSNGNGIPSQPVTVTTHEDGRCSLGFNYSFPLTNSFAAIPARRPKSTLDKRLIRNSLE